MHPRASAPFMCFLLAWGTAPADELDDILAANSRSVGGNAAWSRIANLRMQLTIREPGFEVQGTYVATRAGEMRIDIFADGQRVFAEGLHQGQAWEWTPQSGRKAVGEQPAAALRNGIEAPGKFFTLEQVRERGVTVELVPSEEAAAAGQWLLRLTMGDGRAGDWLIDRQTHRVVRTLNRRAFHPGVDPTETLVETSYEGDLWTDGVLRRPVTTNRNVAEDAWLGTTEVLSVEHNIDIPEDFFSGE